MSGVRDLLIGGSEKVSGHYRLLLARAQSANFTEVESGASSGCWANSVKASRIVSRRDLPAERRPLRDVPGKQMRERAAA
jgi:hypothetical protein